MQAQADAGLRVIGGLGALVHLDGGVGFTRGDDLHPTGAQEGSQLDTEGKVGCFLQLAAVQPSSGIVAAMRRVEDDDESPSRSGRRLLRGNGNGYYGKKNRRCGLTPVHRWPSCSEAWGRSQWTFGALLSRQRRPRAAAPSKPGS